MSMITAMNVIEGNLAANGMYFPPRDGKPALASFRILRTRRWRDQNGQWQEARNPTAYTIEFHGPRADRVRTLIDRNILVKGSFVIAGGQVADRPRTWQSKDGTFNADTVIEGTFITEDTIPAMLKLDRDEARRQNEAQTADHRPEPTGPSMPGPEPYDWNDPLYQEQ